MASINHSLFPLAQGKILNLGTGWKKNPELEFLEEQDFTLSSAESATLHEEECEETDQALVFCVPRKDPEL